MKEFSRKPARNAMDATRDGGCDWTAGISACHAEASEGVERL